MVRQHYAFQFSFATTATTIVSGAVAERMRLDAYVIFSFLNTIVYCIPARYETEDCRQGYCRELIRL